MSNVLVEMSEEDFRFITEYNPERERVANRKDLVFVLDEIATILLMGRLPE